MMRPREGLNGWLLDCHPVRIDEESKMDKTEHECPYGGVVYAAYGVDGTMTLCGMDGQLCPRCKEDRADRRAERIADAIGRLHYFPLGTVFPPTTDDSAEPRGEVPGA